MLRTIPLRAGIKGSLAGSHDLAPDSRRPTASWMISSESFSPVVNAECYSYKHAYTTYYTSANSPAWRRRILPWRPSLWRRGRWCDFGYMPDSLFDGCFPISGYLRTDTSEDV